MHIHYAWIKLISTNSYFSISMFTKALFIVKINCRKGDRKLLFHKVVVDNFIGKIFYISFSIFKIFLNMFENNTSNIKYS